MMLYNIVLLRENLENYPHPIPSTPNSELATKIREIVQKLRPWTGINLKVIERAGQKVQDILHKSNPWDSNDCEREDCFPCTSAAKNEKIVHRDCHKRSVVYETCCQTFSAWARGWIRHGRSERALGWCRRGKSAHVQGFEVDKANHDEVRACRACP